MDTVLKIFLWKKNLTAPNPKIFYVYGGAILVFKGNFFNILTYTFVPPWVKYKCFLGSFSIEIFLELYPSLNRERQSREHFVNSSYNRIAPRLSPRG
jgi:hypothetical protein